MEIVGERLTTPRSGVGSACRVVGCLYCESVILRCDVVRRDYCEWRTEGGSSVLRLKLVSRCSSSSHIRRKEVIEPSWYAGFPNIGAPFRRRTSELPPSVAGLVGVGGYRGYL
jgi:hypothetical protein